MSENKNPAERLLDLFVYAPLGFILNIDEVVPQLVERGRQQVSMARTFGQFAVQQGSTEAQKRVGQLQKQASGVVEQLGTTTARRSAPASASATASAEAGAAAADGAGPDFDGDAPAENELAIPDYDSLSASQVVPRLEGLSGEELDAVRRYEAVNRGRKTILSKIAQLQD
ncbi:MAG: hypothetical protein ACRD0G_06565 [Acidimicrobiales bacterium]